jgi:hypothetical protein
VTSFSIPMLGRQSRPLTLFVAVVGAGLCLLSLVTFVMTILNNTVPWRPDQTMREHYLAIGRSYGDGFLVGFFLCFFLVMIAVGIDRRGVRS